MATKPALTPAMLHALDLAADRWPGWSLHFIDYAECRRETIDRGRRRVFVNLHHAEADAVESMTLHSFAHVELHDLGRRAPFTDEQEAEADALAELLGRFDADDFYPF